MNALLYGNLQVSEPSDSADDADDVNDGGLITLLPRLSKNSTRGKTPESYKLPPGVKATVSSKPGETRDITFYSLKSKGEVNGVTIVDMPGYGFAYGKEGYRDVCYEYLTGVRGGGLKRLMVLVDGRHGLKNADREFLKGMEDIVIRSGKKEGKEELRRFPPLQIVLTKGDLVKQVDLARRVVQVKTEVSSLLRREYGNFQVMVVSAKPGLGYNNVKGKERKAKGGVWEIQREISGLVKKRPS